MNPRSLPILTGLPLLLTAALAAQPTGFPTLQGMVNRMQTAANNFPAICQLVNLNQKYGLPTTIGGNSHYAVRISDNVTQEEDEPTFLMVASHHANEYGTPIVALESIDRFLEGYGVDPTITNLVDTYEIWIAPIWNPDGYFRSRTNGRGVDLNRNYPFLWNSPCSGSTFPGSSTYKGQSAGSESETKLMMAWSEDQRFTKVLDYHSSGREVLYAYRCTTHNLVNYLRNEAIALSNASSYGGRVRPPSAEGEHYHWQLGNYSNYAFLTEISNTQSPTISSALSEATRLWPGTLWMLQRPIPVSGHIRDAVSGAPISANVSYLEAPFTQGEKNTSEPLYGRYHAFLPNGSYTLRIQHPCYITQDVPVTVTSSGVVVDIALQPDPAALAGQAMPRNGTGVNPVALSGATPIIGQAWSLTIDPASVPGAPAVAFLGFRQGANGPVIGAGELLVDLSSPSFLIAALPAAGAPVTIGGTLPTDPGFVGFTGTFQGLIYLPAGGGRLTNALDVTVGCR